MQTPHIVLIGSFDNEWHCEQTLRRTFSRYTPDAFVVEACPDQYGIVDSVGCEIDELILAGKAPVREAIEVVDTLYSLVSTPQAAIVRKYAQQRGKALKFVSTESPHQNVEALCDEALLALRTRSPARWILEKRSKACSKHSRQKKRSHWQQILDYENSLCQELAHLYRRFRGDYSADENLASITAELVEGGSRVVVLSKGERLMQSRFNTTLAGRLRSYDVKRIPLLV